jgi:hypothetical protein
VERIYHIDRGYERIEEKLQDSARKSGDCLDEAMGHGPLSIDDSRGPLAFVYGLFHMAHDLSPFVIMHCCPGRSSSPSLALHPHVESIDRPDGASWRAQV